MVLKRGQGILRLYGDTYHVQWYQGGRKRSRSLKTGDKRVAERRARQIVAAERLREASRDGWRLSESALREAERVGREVSESAGRRCGAALANFAEWAGDIVLDEVDSAMVERYQRERLQRAAQATVRQEVYFVRHMLAENGIEVALPKARPGRKTRVRAFTRDELVRVFRAVTEEQRALYATLLVTAARPTELVPSRYARHVALLKEDLRPEENAVLIQTAKGHRGAARRPRLILVPAEVMEMLVAEAARTPGPHVFHSSTNLARNFDAMLARAGIAKRNERGEILRLHSFRHTYATLLAHSVAPFILQQMLGHSQVTTTQRYVDDATAQGPVLNVGVSLGPKRCENGWEAVRDGEEEKAVSTGK